MCDPGIFWILVVVSHLVWVPLSLVRSQHAWPQFSPGHWCSALWEAVYACARGGRTQAHTVLRNFQFYLYPQHSCSTKWKSLSHVRLFGTPWLYMTIYSQQNSPGQNIGVGSLSLLQGIFPTQELNPGLPHCRQILYQLSHKGSPRIPEWIAYPFSSKIFST